MKMTDISNKSDDTKQTYSIRLSKKDHDAAEKIFADLGLDWSNGIKIYLRQLIKRKAIPFTLVTQPEEKLIPNEETKKALEIAHAEEKGLIPDSAKDFTNSTDAMRYLFGKK